MLPDYNAQTIKLQANPAAGFFDESYLKKEYTCIIFVFSMWQTSKNKEKRLSFDVRYSNSQDM